MDGESPAREGRVSKLTPPSALRAEAPLEKARAIARWSAFEGKLIPVRVKKIR
jgi:hypothetical protein